MCRTHENHLIQVERMILNSPFLLFFVLTHSCKIDSEKDAFSIFLFEYRPSHVSTNRKCCQLWFFFQNKRMVHFWSQRSDVCSLQRIHIMHMPLEKNWSANLRFFYDICFLLMLSVFVSRQQTPVFDNQVQHSTPTPPIFLLTVNKHYLVNKTETSRRHSKSLAAKNENPTETRTQKLIWHFQTG